MREEKDFEFYQDFQSEPPRPQKQTFRIPLYITILLYLIVFLFIIIALGILVSKFKSSSGSDSASNSITIDDNSYLSQKTLLEVIAPAEELITCKYYYTDADVYEKAQTFFGSSVKVPFTTDQTVFTFTGVISAGIDLEELKFDIDHGSKTITISLPKAKIMHNEIDEKSFTEYNIKDSAFTSMSVSDYTDFTEELKAAQAEKLNSNEEFWETVNENAKKVIETLIKQSAVTEDYHVKFED